MSKEIYQVSNVISPPAGTWRPDNIIINNKVKNDPVTLYVLSQCSGIPVEYVDSGKAKEIIEAYQPSDYDGQKLLDKIKMGKSVLYIAPASTGVVDTFDMVDDRLKCPHFHRIKFASNGCYYICDWCYLKLTFRAGRPFITIYVQYDKIKAKLQKILHKASGPVIFNSGELADSLSLDHLTHAGREFIPWFGQTINGYLFMLTKSDNVDDLLGLQHNEHTIIAWSINNAMVSRKFEVGAPTLERRLNAAQRVQQAGYPVRLRLDPIVPFEDWQQAYAETVRDIFARVNPERITLGTLRFEKGFYDQRNSIFSTGSELSRYLENMQPMFPPLHIPGRKKPLVGKYSFSEEQRIDIFNFIIAEIRKYSDCKIALCKESETVWQQVGLDLSKCSCVCQLDYADMS